MNGSFEDVGTASASFSINNTTILFWVHLGASPDGGNFVAIDGDPNFAVPLTQTVTGLTPGERYSISFYQAAA